MEPLRCLSSLRRAGVPLVRRLSCGHSRRLTTKGGEGGAKTLHLVRHAESNWNVLTAGGELFSATFVASIRDAIAMLPDQRAVPSQSMSVPTPTSSTQTAAFLPPVPTKAKRSAAAPPPVKPRTIRRSS
eukprot:COSAG05_NODE_101_length_19100_cov_24.260144_3_plen_129_part_00